MLDLGLFVALMAMLSFAASDTIAKKVSAKMGSKRATMIMLGGSILPLLVGAYFFGLGQINLTTVFFSVVSGVVYSGAFLLLYKSLETKQVSNTISLSGIEWALIIAFSVLVLGEKVTRLQLLCFVGIFVGAFLVTTTRKFVFDRGYLPAVASMFGFAASYALLIYALQGSGGVLLPTLINRATAVLAMFAYLVISPESNKKFLKTRRLSDHRGLVAGGMLMGVFNGMASIFVLSLATLNFVAVGSVIVAAEPAIVILLAYALYKERFAKQQAIGFILLIMSILILSAA
jgi:drug/metabolite transporter (DMT)-like permease